MKKRKIEKESNPYKIVFILAMINIPVSIAYVIVTILYIISITG